MECVREKHAERRTERGEPREKNEEKSTKGRAGVIESCLDIRCNLDVR